MPTEFAVPPAFWSRYFAEHHARRPAVWRRPFPSPIATPAEAFAWLVAAGERARAGDERVLVRVFAGLEAVDPSDSSVLPVLDDGGCAGYLARLAARFGETGAMINHVHAVDPRLFVRIQRFLSGLYAGGGAPAGGALLDLFLGAYRTSFLGLHKDEQDVFTFVLEGRKRFLVWPFEVFADHPAVGTGAESSPVMLGDHDYEAERHRAVALEGGPGDVFYWPSDHWHVGESDGTPCTTFSLGLFGASDPARFLAEAARALADDGALGVPRHAPHALAHGGGDARAALDAAAAQEYGWLHDARVRERADERRLGWMTSFGLRPFPEPRPRAELCDTARLRPGARGAFAWYTAGDGALVWSATGRVFRQPDPGGALARLLARLDAGATVTVSELLARAPDPEPARALLVALYRHHALELDARAP